MKKYLAVAVILLFIGLAFVQNIDAIPDFEKSNLTDKSEEHITIFYANITLEFSTDNIRNRYLHIHSEIHGSIHHLDSNLDNLTLKIIVNYTAEMNYTTKFPFLPAPLVMFGLKVENYTDFNWELFKLKHHGYDKQDGNFSVEFGIDMENIESGDILKLQPIISRMHIPFLKNPNENKTRTWELLVRFIYNIPLLNRILLYHWIFPILVPYNSLTEIPQIWLFFH